MTTRKVQEETATKEGTGNLIEEFVKEHGEIEFSFSPSRLFRFNRFIVSQNVHLQYNKYPDTAIQRARRRIVKICME